NTTDVPNPAAPVLSAEVTTALNPSTNAENPPAGQPPPTEPPATEADRLSGKPLAPASGERGWGEGEGQGPLTPNPPPPSTGARGEESPTPLPDKTLSFLQPGTQPGSLGRLGHFEVLELIGKGGFGIVLKAFDENLQRLVAIKVLGPQLAGNANARSRFV